MSSPGDHQSGGPADRPAAADLRARQDRLDRKLGAALERLSEQVDRAKSLLATLEPDRAGSTRGRKCPPVDDDPGSGS